MKMEKAKKVEEMKVILENDFSEAQRILNTGKYTREFDAWYLYNDRIESEKFNCTFKIKVEREQDYKRFIDLVNEYFPNIRITFEEWKSGRLANGQRLGKYLRKVGFPQEVLDFYSSQIKTEKEVFLTVTDKAQYIAGMSYYSPGNWDGMGGKSCQCPVVGGKYAQNLVGALHDDKLYIGFLHENIDDLQDMEDKMLARVVFRLLEDFAGKESVLIATRYYGNNESKDLLHKSLKELEKVAPIYSNDALGSEEYRESANGYAEVEMVKDIHVYAEDWEYMDVECPLCHGHGWTYGYDADGREYEVDCPHCGGTGTIEIEHYYCVDEYVEVEVDEEIPPYAEEYSHYGYYVEIDIDSEYIISKMEERKREREEVKEGA